MTSAGPIDPEALRRMREVLFTAIATRSASILEAAAEARGLGRGLQPALPTSAISNAVDKLLTEIGAYEPQPEPVDAKGHPLVPVDPAEVADSLAADSLAYATRFDERGKARRTGVEYAAQMATELLVRRLAASGFVVMRRAPAPFHSAGD